MVMKFSLMKLNVCKYWWTTTVKI